MMKERKICEINLVPLSRHIKVETLDIALWCTSDDTIIKAKEAIKILKPRGVASCSGQGKLRKKNKLGDFM